MGKLIGFGLVRPYEGCEFEDQASEVGTAADVRSGHIDMAKQAVQPVHSKAVV